MAAPLIRRIAHLDMDAFYASVELLRYPQLKGLPVVIGGARRSADNDFSQTHADVPLSRIPVADFPRLAGYTGRGVITTATYAARQSGVGSAMGLMKAAKLCPEAILLPVDFAEIRRYSRAFKDIILDIAPVMEDRGVDEVFIDFTEVPGGQRDGGRVLARLIQKTIFQATGLTCSLGVAPNKLLAKMASEFNKPNGIAVVYESDVPSKIWPLACRKINGVGPKAEEKLLSLGITTIGQLAQKDVDWLIEPVSISRETTFERDLHAVRDKAELGAIFTRLCEQVAADLAAKGYVGKTIGIKLRFDDFKSVTRDQTVDAYVGDAKTIRQVAGLCLKRVPLTQRLRLLGVRVGSLVRRDEAQTREPHRRNDMNLKASIGLF